VPTYAGSVFFVLGHDDVEGGLWASLQLAPIILLPLVILRCLIILGGCSSPMTTCLPLVDLANLLPIELDHVHIRREQVFVELYLGTFCKFESSFVYDRLNLSMKNIAIVSSMRIRIMPFVISMLFELFRRWYDMITWQFNLFLLQQ
jgi:hypothetical protein